MVAFESRMASELTAMIARFGGGPDVVPSMRELPLEDNQPCFDFARKLLDGGFDAVVFLTGVGVRELFRIIETRYPRPTLLEALSRIVSVARGSKPDKALRDLGLRPTLTAAEPSTWHEVLSCLSGAVELQGKRVAVQEYGISNQELRSGLERLGASVTPVPVYRWALPVDCGPLNEALRAIAAGKRDVAIFTNANQIVNLMHLAKAAGIEEQVRFGFNAMAVCSIGPDCSAGLRANGLAVDLEPQHSRLGHLVKEAAQQSGAILQRKRGEQTRNNQ